MDARPDKPHIPYRRPSDGVAATPTTTTTEEYDNRHRPILDLNDPMVRARYEAVESAAGMARIAMAIGDRGMLRTACIEGLKASEAVGIKGNAPRRRLPGRSGGQPSPPATRLKGPWGRRRSPRSSPIPRQN